MISSANVRSALETEVEACVATLSAAFEADPICRWAWPDSDVYREAFPEFSLAFGGAAFERRAAHVDSELQGVALWLPPGATPDEERLGELVERTAPERLQEPIAAIFEQMASYHPAETHWHLPLIGVHPSAQGRGLGSVLLRHALSQCDEEGLPAYLEATSPDNVRLYERHGFEAIGRIQAGDSPPMIPMIRRPRA